tara:strand:- start:96 stop:572 length:477 start_codon:yes stop_codon:yes gene_type:complete
MTLKKLHAIFKISIISAFLISTSHAEILKPRSDIKPAEVIGIQLAGLQKNDYNFKDSGIEQTWNFAHPNNKKVTGPLEKFKKMIKSASYQMMINHLSHTITKIESGDNWVQFEVIILDKEKIYHKFNWQVEKYLTEGPLKDCWLTTMVSSPIPLGSSI